MLKSLKNKLYNANPLMLIKWLGIGLYLYHLYGGFIRSIKKKVFLSTTFGYSIIAIIVILLITYTRYGRKYFTSYFRLLMMILLLTSILRQIHFLIFIDFYLEIQASLYTVSICLLVFIVGLITGFNYKDDEKPKE